MSRGLEGICVVVTRAEHQAEALAELLEARGATVVTRPVIELSPIDDEHTRAAFARLRAGDFDAVAVTSPNAAVRVMGELGGAAPPRVFAIGEATARVLRERGVAEVEEAGEATSEGLLETMIERLPAGARLLLPQARDARDVLVHGLGDAGLRVEVVTIYETRPVSAVEALPEEVDWVTFASPSAVRAFVARFGVVPAAVACIGRVTLEAARAAGFWNAVAPDAPSLEAMVELIDASSAGAPRR